MNEEARAHEQFFRTDAEDSWHRVHPVSPFVRGWVAIVAVIFVFGRNSLSSLFSEDWGGGGSPTGGAPALFIAMVVGAAIVIFGVAFFLSWRFTRYQVTDQHVHINSGVVFRQQRRARIDRVQAIDVVQPLVARMFGLAELKFEVADGGKSAMKLSFLKLTEAKRLRAAILARAAGVSVDPQAPEQVQEAPEHHVLSLNTGRIIGAAVISSTTVFALLVIAAAVVAVVWSGSPGILVAAIPIFIGIGAAYWKSITTDFNFRVAVSPDGVRLHYGMLETRSQTIPPGRVQAVGISQGPIWRPFGWYRVHVNVAGYGADASDNGSRTVLLPAGTLEEVMTVLSLVFPDPGVENPFDVFTAGLRGPGNTEGFVHSPRSARWIDPLAWRYNAFRATQTALLCRHGVLFRRLQVVPHERTQSLGLRQGPLMAALGLVDFELHSTVGPIRPLVHHMSVANALQLFDEQAVRAATARRLHRNERWLESEVDPFPGISTQPPRLVKTADEQKFFPEEHERGH
ncbi:MULTISPECIES: PH domain-containing protein [Arthrobacter]|uniref:PH domain-containing protein n=1 Tax=unclassified Arthrobacter TaxID=235627 RepID=UPI0024B8D08D|nr:PH domain-containing protein [Arthrobacter sp. H35-MC1]MDJ0316710.1 PH domain-containing protein [Arthrobacter sp. H35-MC1]